MIGYLEQLLTRLYGSADVVDTPMYSQYDWMLSQESLHSVLYKGLIWDSECLRSYEDLRPIYGDAYGGILIQDSLKVAIINGPSIYGLYSIKELRLQKEVIGALEIDSHIHYFMDASNVWFYGIKNGRLFEFDSATDELNDLGDIQPALETVINRWIEASP